MKLIRALLVLAVFGFLMAMLFPKTGNAADLPITSMPQAWTGVVVDFQANPLRACVAGWERSKDKYGDYERRAAFIDCSKLSTDQCSTVTVAAVNGDLLSLITMRTASVDDPAMQPCLAKLKAPPYAWIVVPAASGTRPAYLLNADGSRGKTSGKISTTIDGSPTWCRCKVRATGTSVYCQASDDSEQPIGTVRVTLCREAK